MDKGAMLELASRLRELLATAKPGPPWEIHQDDATGCFEIRSAYDGDVDGDTGQHIVVGGALIALMADALGEYDNAALIVEAVNALPALLDALASQVDHAR